MAKLAALVDPAVTALAETRGFSREERQTIITLIKEQTMRSHAVDHACSVVLAEIGTRDFEWPEFDRWHTLFTMRGHFPPLWDGVARRPVPDDPWPARRAYLDRKLYLLIDWLHGLVVTRAEMRAALTRYTVLGLPAEITRQSAEITCPACDLLDSRDALHPPGDVPPFHPGCRCLVLAARARLRPGGPEATRRVARSSS
jgi:hypothetical protein